MTILTTNDCQRRSSHRSIEYFSNFPIRTRRNTAEPSKGPRGVSLDMKCLFLISNLCHDSCDDQHKNVLKSIVFRIFNAINLFFLIFWADFKWSWEMNGVLTGWERPGQILLEFLQRRRTRRLPIITAYKICAANPELETHFIHFEIQYQHLETQVPLKIWESGPSGCCQALNIW